MNKLIHTCKMKSLKCLAGIKKVTVSFVSALSQSWFHASFRQEGLGRCFASPCRVCYMLATYRPSSLPQQIGSAVGKRTRNNLYACLNDFDIV